MVIEKTHQGINVNTQQNCLNVKCNCLSCAVLVELILPFTVVYSFTIKSQGTKQCTILARH